MTRQTDTSGPLARLRRWLRPDHDPPRARTHQPALPPDRSDAPTAHILCIGTNLDPDALVSLADRLLDDLPKLRLATLQQASTGNEPAFGAVIDTIIPPDDYGRRATEEWLGQTRPRLILSIGTLAADPQAAGTLLASAVAMGIPVLAVDMPEPPAALSRNRRAGRAALAPFTRVLARDTAAADALRQISGPSLRIEVAGRFDPVPEPPPCADSERDHFSRIVGTRPVWLAAGPDTGEVSHLLAAHRAALRAAHRLLLVVLPRLAAPDANPGSALATSLRAEGWRVARNGADEEPEEETEIYIADDPEDAGLWYRIAPVTVLGGTFSPASVTDPTGPACLGSALIAGPQIGGAPAILARLDAAGALRRVAEPDELSPAISDLLAPDRAAGLAHAAWDAISEPARVQERVVAAIQDALRNAPS